ncbi:MAG: hypothetical protein AUI08_00510 [Gemmatimonadetes bacterium 13_2_20CM_2_65_7]|nr:MAG: hypothetical protein AUI08_00510 [Gemmatimonadetes bacterium 13_2_20CM_2_65_7]OLD00822.1 MAG: hypothetical protein AUI89_05405 [Gemmatimonadetes bacterium 13_1_40CM_3_65_8]
MEQVLEHHFDWIFSPALKATRRAIDFHEGDEIDEETFKRLIRAAAALNRSSAVTIRSTKHRQQNR